MWRSAPIPEELSVFPGYLLARLGERSRRRLHQALAPAGLHPRHFGVLAVVAANPGCTQQQLHRKTAIAASSIVAVLDELEAGGLAERRLDPGDRRARAIFLTAHGERELARVRALTRGLQAELFAALTPGERDTLLTLLRKLAAAAG